MEKWRYEQAVSECKRWRILIKRFLGETLLSFQKKELENVWSEYV